MRRFRGSLRPRHAGHFRRDRVVLYWFLGPSTPAQRPLAIWVDALLALQFAVPHSLLLLPARGSGYRADSAGILRMLLLRGHLFQFACDVCRLAANATGPMAGYGHYAARSIKWSFLGLVGGAVLQPALDRARLSDWFDAVAGIGCGGNLLPRRRLRRRAGPILWLRHPVYLSFLG